MSDVTQRLRALQRAIAEAEQQAERRPGDVQLLAVSKKQSVAKILEAYAGGQRAFAENFVQEALPKIAELSSCEIVWHFIGALQSNKARVVAEHFSWVHTIDREKIAVRLNESRRDTQPPLNICIQVNIDREPTKSGVFAEQVPEFAIKLSQLERLRLRGLMVIPKPREQYADQLAVFKTVAKLLRDCQQQGLEMDTLSMGMSQDFPAAIAAGSTMVRIGTALFGPRNLT